MDAVIGEPPQPGDKLPSVTLRGGETPSSSDNSAVSLKVRLDA